MYEGSGNRNGERQTPKRNPVFTEDLTKDEQDLISLQMSDYKRGVKIASTQTEQVIIMSSDDEIRNGMMSVRDIGIQCNSTDANCTKDSLILYLEKLLALESPMTEVDTDRSPPSTSTETLQLRSSFLHLLILYV